MLIMLAYWSRVKVFSFSKCFGSLMEVFIFLFRINWLILKSLCWTELLLFKSLCVKLLGLSRLFELEWEGCLPKDFSFLFLTSLENLFLWLFIKSLFIKAPLWYLERLFIMKVRELGFVLEYDCELYWEVKRLKFDIPGGELWKIFAWLLLCLLIFLKFVQSKYI